MSPQNDRLPAYDELPVTPGAPTGSSWGLWGPRDTFGCLNLLTPERALSAAQRIQRGAVFPLNWDCALPNPALFNRPSLEHQIEHRAMRGFPATTEDDVLHNFNPQASTQWDGFRHYGTPDEQFYNGIPVEEHGVDHWARRGIVGRAVLLDVARWRAQQGAPLDLTVPDAISADDLHAILRAQNAQIETGDIILIHTGWIAWYTAQPQDVRDKIGTLRAPRTPGLRAGREMVQTLWDWHIAAIASDTPTMEVAPFGRGLSEEEQQSSFASLHNHLLPMLGIPIGEMWDLTALAADCADDGIYACFLTSAPIHVRGGVASPANALAIK